MQLRRPDHTEALAIILKLTGNACNINCRYCYEKRKPSESFAKLTPDLVERVLAHLGQRAISVELHGGEPLLLTRLEMAAILETLRRYPGPCRLTLQTNGILLTDEWLDFFEREWPDLALSTSLDGPNGFNRHRVNYSGQETTEKVENLLERLSARGQSTGLVCTVTQLGLGDPKSLLTYFRRFSCVNLLKFNPCFDYNAKLPTHAVSSLTRSMNSTEQGVPGWGITPLEFRDFLIKLFDVWVDEKLYTTLLVEPFLSILRSLQGKKSNFCVYDDRKCAYILTLYPDGRITSCDELPATEGLLQNSATNLNHLPSLDDNPQLRDELALLISKCASCHFQKICRGGCLATRRRYIGTRFYEDYCVYRIGVIEHVAKFMDIDI